MADEVNYVHHPNVEEPCKTNPVAVETGDRGLFDWKKDEEKKFEADKDELIATEFEEKVQVCDEDKKEDTKHKGLLENLHRTSNSSSSSSEEEYEDENGEKKKRKKSLKEKIFGEKKEEMKSSESYVPVVEKCDDVPSYEPEEKSHVPVVEKCDDIPTSYESGEKEEVFDKTPALPPVAEEKEEKKGFLEKIKEKLPGFKSEDEKEKEKEKECN